MRNATIFFLRRLFVCLSVLAPCLLTAQVKEPVKYIGPDSCAATNCHVNVKPIAVSRILQNEYSTWILQEKHSRVYQALTVDVLERMACILKLSVNAGVAPDCL